LNIEGKFQWLNGVEPLILGIEVVDHIVVTKDGFSSFKEKGLIF